jgi:hypothetical protein
MHPLSIGRSESTNQTPEGLKGFWHRSPDRPRHLPALTFAILFLSSSDKGNLHWAFHLQHIVLNRFRGFLHLIYLSTTGISGSLDFPYGASHSPHIATGWWIPHGCTAMTGVVCHMTPNSRCFSVPLDKLGCCIAPRRRCQWKNCTQAPRATHRSAPTIKIARIQYSQIWWCPGVPGLFHHAWIRTI